MQAGEQAARGKRFTFRDRDHLPKDLATLITQVDGELEADYEKFHRMDRDVFLAHWSLARQLDRGGTRWDGRQKDLMERYRFHDTVQQLLRGIFGKQAELQGIFALLMTNSQLQQQDFQAVCNTLRDIHRSSHVKEAKGVTTPALTNVPAGSSLTTCSRSEATPPCRRSWEQPSAPTGSPNWPSGWKT